MPAVDVARLRAEAAARAAARPRLPFAGTVADETVAGVPARRYTPAGVTATGTTLLFLHGGYGILGDLDLQDGPCRRIAALLRLPVLSLAYRLAPEATFAESFNDALGGMAALHREGRRVVLWGDSAGGAVAIAAASAGNADALLLSNPNVDLSLSRFDDTAPGGPDRELSAWAFARWTGSGASPATLDLAPHASNLPPTFIATGADDALLPDARHLAARCAAAGVRTELHIPPHTAHGFLSTPTSPTTTGVLHAAARFIAATAQSHPHLLLDI